MKPSRFKIDDTEVTGKTTGYDGFFKIETYSLKHRLFEGGWSNEIYREVFERGHAVAVLPFDPETGEVVLIEQFRVGALFAAKSKWFSDDFSPWLIETVAGIIDPGEMPEDVAKREAVEETGLEVTDLVPVCHYLVSPGGTTESVFVFVGRTRAADASGVHGKYDEGEDIRPFAVPLEEANAAIADGRIVNAMTIIAVQWLMMNKDKVLAEWGTAPR